MRDAGLLTNTCVANTAAPLPGTPPQYTEIYICSKPLGAVEWHSTRPRLVANTCVGNTCVANTCVANTGQVAHVDVLIHADLVDAYDMYQVSSDTVLHGLRHADLELDDLVDGASDLEHDGLLWQTFSKVSTLVYLLYKVTIEGTF